MSGPVTLADLLALFPDGAIEEAGKRRELVIYTGLSVATYDPVVDVWTEMRDGRLVPMPEDL